MQRASFLDNLIYQDSNTYTECKSMKKKLVENYTILKEIALLIRTKKKWWLVPILIVFSVLSLFLVLAGDSSILPAIYVLF